MRSSKTVNGTKYTYIYNGSLLAMQKWGNKSLRFIYDNNGSPYAVVYNNGSTDTVYYYIKNQQGDVTMIVDQNIGIVAKYNYDAWGKLLSVTNASGTTLTSGIGIDNPIRYRGYYYDNETGWYYLNSRYYDPSVCRFINADDVSTVTSSNTISDKNLYAYCDNNPVNRADDEGDFWWLLKAAVGVATQYASDVLNNIADGKSGWDILKPTSSIGEYVAVGVTALIPGSGLGSALLRSAVSESIIATEKVIKGGKVNLKSSATSIFRNTLRDFGTEKIAKTVSNTIRKAAPKNYSSYAHKIRQKHPNMSRNDISDKLLRTTKRIHAIASVGEKLTSFSIGFLRRRTVRR